MTIATGKHLTGAGLQFRGLWWHKDSHGVGQAAESSTFRSASSRKRILHWAWLEHLKPEGPLPVATKAIPIKQGQTS